MLCVDGAVIEKPVNLKPGEEWTGRLQLSIVPSSFCSDHLGLTLILISSPMDSTQLEETLAQFMQVSMSNHKSIESAIKNMEIQVGQLAKQIAENSSRGFGANTEKKSQRRMQGYHN